MRLVLLSLIAFTLGCASLGSSPADQRCYLVHKVWYSACQTAEIVAGTCTQGAIMQRQAILVKHPGQYPAVAEGTEYQAARACDAWGVAEPPRVAQTPKPSAPEPPHNQE